MFSLINPVYYLSIFDHFPQISLVSNLLSYFRPYQQLHTDVEQLAWRVSTEPSYQLREEELETVKSAIRSGHLQKTLSELPPDILQQAFNSLLQHDLSSQKAIETFLSTLDEICLSKLSGIKEDQIDAIRKTRDSLKDVALTSVFTAKSRAIWKEIFPEVIYLGHHLLEMFITITGLNQIGKSRHSAVEEYANASVYEAKAKLEFYLSMLAYPSTIFGIVYLYLGATISSLAITTGIILTTLISIAIYMRYLRPCPADCVGMENLTIRVLRQEEDPVYPRQDILTKIQNAFRAGKGVVLVGDTGAGKNSIVESLALQIAEKTNSPDFLIGQQVFQTTAAALTKIGGFNSIDFATIRRRFENHQKSAIFFFNEIHGAFKKEGTNGDHTDLLLDFCDYFPYVIGATTTKQFKEHIEKNAEFMRRVDIIDIDPLQPGEAEASLYLTIHKKVPELILGKDVVSYIVEKAADFKGNTSQIDAAQALLSRAIDEATVLSCPAIEEKIYALQLEIDHLQNTLLHQDDANSSSQYIAKKQELNDYKEQFAKKRQELKNIRKIENEFLKHKQQTYKLASGNPKAWLKESALSNILSKAAQHKRQIQGLPPKLDKALIDGILSKK